MYKQLTTIFLLQLAAVNGSLAQSPNSCNALLQAQIPGINLQVTEAKHFESREVKNGPFALPASLSAHCHLVGEIDRRTGLNDVSYALRFAINMPDNWNGRFLFQGGGGLNGSLGEPLGNQATGGRSALDRGFAVVSTDSGHEGGGFDAGFMADQEAALNFHFLGNMRVTNAAKLLVEQYYSQDINKSYFVGCSTGGREGMIMAQRYPQLYDGIVTGAPAMRTGNSNLALRWINVQLNQAQSTGPKDPDQKSIFSKAEQQVIMTGLLASCDALDGAKDGLIFNVAGCHFDPRSLACPVGQTENCLQVDKAEALVKALAGPVDSRGEQVYSRFVLDTGADDPGFIAGLLVAGGSPPVGDSSKGSNSQNVDAEAIAVSAFDSALGDSTSFRLSSFSGHGGKQIFYHGLSDPWFSAMETLWYYNNMSAVNGGLQTVDKFSRLFMVPGMGHCQGGEQTLDSFDMLSAIVDWVEKDQAPDSVVATGNSMPGVSRPLCPYPQHPHYSGNGDINSAENFNCRSE